MKLKRTTRTSFDRDYEFVELSGKHFNLKINAKIVDCTAIALVILVATIQL